MVQVSHHCWLGFAWHTSLITFTLVYCYTCGYEPQRTVLGLIPQNIHPFILYFATVSLTDLKLVKFAELTSHRASGICLALPPWHWVTHVCHYVPFVLFWGFKNMGSWGQIQVLKQVRPPGFWIFRTFHSIEAQLAFRSHLAGWLFSTWLCFMIHTYFITLLLLLTHLHIPLTYHSLINPSQLLFKIPLWCSLFPSLCFSCGSKITAAISFMYSSSRFTGLFF